MRTQAAHEVAVAHRIKPYMQFFLGRALLRLGMLGVTKEAFEPVLAIDPNLPQRDRLITILEQIDGAIASP